MTKEDGNYRWLILPSHVVLSTLHLFVNLISNSLLFIWFTLDQFQWRQNIIILHVDLHQNKILCDTVSKGNLTKVWIITWKEMLSFFKRFTLLERILHFRRKFYQREKNYSQFKRFQLTEIKELKSTNIYLLLTLQK